ncbi:MAG: hypothetical protein Ta2B_27970 [Termitinemataceae bacterium]|nr:MAG: hypothetical protein Ta2B_27970 [Termitinemataceae bacterium]
MKKQNIKKASLNTHSAQSCVPLVFILIGSKKAIILTTMFTIVLGAVFSQDNKAANAAKTNPVPYHWYIGVYGGISDNTLYGSKISEKYRNYSASSYFKVNYKTLYSNETGFTVGIPIRYQILSWLAVQTEPTFITKNYSWKRSSSDSSVNRTYQNITNSFIDFPIMINFSYPVWIKNLRIYANVGGFLGVWILSHAMGTTNIIAPDVYDMERHYNQYADYDENIPFDSRRDNQFDAGLLAGTGFQYSFKAFNIFFEVRFNYSLTDLQKPYDTVEQVPNMNDTWTFFAGVMFNAALFGK